MRILFVGLPQSPHSARHVNILTQHGWDIHFFPTLAAPPLPDFKNMTFYQFSAIRPPGIDPSVRIRGAWPLRLGTGLLPLAAERLWPKVAERHRWLATLIRWLQPDIIHAQTLFAGGSLTLQALNLFLYRYPNRGFPPWIVGNWGADIHCYGRLQNSAGSVRAVLSACDYYTCECERDVELARELGFKGQVLDVLPIGGGYDVVRAQALRQPGPSSARRVILMKGYQSRDHIVGRALVGLRALERCADVLTGYRVAIYSASEDVKLAATLMAQRTGIPIEIIAPPSADDMLRWYGKARIYLGLSLSDGISTSMLEAMIMGALPIQSNTACVDEWVCDGDNALVVPPEDPGVVEAALRRALSDDQLVDHAAEINLHIAKSRLDQQNITPKVIAMYEKVGLRKAPAFLRSRPRILFVALPDSVHAARWINMLAEEGWDVHLFPTYNFGNALAEFRNVTVHSFSARRPPGVHSSVRLRGRIPSRLDFWGADTFAEHYLPQWFDRAKWLTRVIEEVQPELIHSLEFQRAAYLTLAAKEKVKGRFPPWMVTSWGSDIYLFGKLPEHVDRIKAVLANCDYYWCECRRDVGLALEHGFKGEILPILPCAGGLDLKRAKQLRQPGPTSSRRLVLLKGYQGWVYRGLVGLRAIEMCADILQGYRVGVYLGWTSAVQAAVDLVAQSTGLTIDLLPFVPDHDEMLRRHGMARVSIGLSISDAISTSFLEAIVMGSFPIQSNTGCADEWACDGSTALFVHPDDPEAVAEALRRALTDDELVDRAAEENQKTVAARLDRSALKSRTISEYTRVLSSFK